MVVKPSIAKSRLGNGVWAWCGAQQGRAREGNPLSLGPHWGLTSVLEVESRAKVLWNLDSLFKRLGVVESEILRSCRGI